MILLVGAGVVRRVLLPGLAAPDLWRRVRVAALVGALLTVGFGAADLYVTLTGVLGSPSRALLLDFTTSSRQGRHTLARTAPVLILALLALAPSAPAAASTPAGRLAAGRAGTALWAAAALALLYLVSAVSHAAAMPGRLPVPADLVHLAAAACWAGAVLGVAFLPLWDPSRRDALTRAMTRVSRIGLAAVLVLAATGAYGAFLHVGEPASLVTTRYGAALLTKIALVAAIAAIAGANRLSFLPALVRGGPTHRLRRALRMEAVLLLLVLAATAWLTTSPVPH